MISKDNAKRTLFTSLKFTMTAEELEKLRNKLPSKYLKLLHDRTGKSKTYVWQVLNGQRVSSEIIDAAILLARQTTIAEQNQKELISNL